MLTRGSRLAFIVLFLSFSLITKAQEYAQAVWLGFTDQLGTEIHEIDNHGNAYVSMSHSTDKWSSFLFPNGDSDGPKVFAKLSAEGKLLWSVPFTHTIYHVKADEQENVYISGVGSVTLSSGKVLPGGSFVIKFDKTGKSLWGVVSESSLTTISGPIALAKDGIYWCAPFYHVTNLQGRKLTSALPGSSDNFVAKINSSGTVTALYRDNHSGYIHEMVEAEDGKVAFIIGRGGNMFKVLLNEQCQVESDKPFILHYLPAINKTSDGYEMLSRVHTHSSASGSRVLGYYHLRFNRNMDLIDSVKIFDANEVLPVYQSAGSSETGFFVETWPEVHINNRKEWRYMDPDYNFTVIPDENAPTLFAWDDNAFDRYYVKMVGDTLHMLVRRYTFYYGNTFTFNKQVYTTAKSHDFSWFWAKYVFKEPCNKIRVSMIQSGKEGSRSAKVRFALSASCLAPEDVIINISAGSVGYENDIGIPPTVTIKKGESFAELELPVEDDNVIEGSENFKLAFSIPRDTTYKLSKAIVKVLVEDDDERQLLADFPLEVTEGASGIISISIPDGKVFPADIHLSLKLKPQVFSADTLLDFIFPPMLLPAYTNRIEVHLTALDDDLLEGDEFIEGDLTRNTDSLGIHSEIQQPVHIKVIDPDNTFENRLFYITPAIDTILEGNSQTYHIKLKAPLTLQRPIAIEAWPSQPLPAFVSHTPATFTYNVAGNDLTVLHSENFTAAPGKSIIFNWIASDLHTGNYRFSWDNDESGRMEIFLPDKEFHFSEVPNTFSPNGDGINDTWTIKSLEGIRCSIWIYNRYGGVVYQSINYTQPWDGKSNGTSLPAGSYYYKIKVAAKEFGGNINIIR